MSTEETIYTVGEFIDNFNDSFSSKNYTIVGEISSVSGKDNYKFISICDEDGSAKIGCYAWRSVIDNYGMDLKVGNKIKVTGHPTIYKASGNFSFFANEISPEGEGELHKAFLKLKADLQKEGFFEQARPIPRFVKKIGLITSETGDAINDFKKNLISVGIEVYFVPVYVEGAYAINSIITGINKLNSLKISLDAIIIIRGGGSWESLKAFNSREVAMAIFNSKTPTVVGVGHEKDETIADYVADLRVSTPTAAATHITDNWKWLENKVNTELGLLSSKIKSSLSKSRVNVNNLESSIHVNMQKILRNYKNRISDRSSSISNKMARLIETLKKNIVLWKGNIEKSNPSNIMKKGYSLVSHQGKPINKAALLKVGDNLNINFYKGSAKTEVKELSND